TDHPAAAAQPTMAAGKQVLYWHDPMVPGHKFDKPGKSPFMDMPLVPVYADSGGDEGALRISPRMQQNLGVRTAPVTRGTLSQTVQAVGSVAYNERDVALVQARANGFVEKLHVRASLDPVRKHQALAEIYVPEWVAAQEEFLSAQRVATGGLAPRMESLVDGARQRMRLAGMSEAQIRRIESSGKVLARFTVNAPIGGVITELAAREGMTVMAGAPLFRINGLGTVWIHAEVPENVATQVLPGNAVTARSAALPGVTLKGRVNAILPEIAVVTRTLKVRIELDNGEGRLVPGMFVTVDLTPAQRQDVLLVPSEAVIRTGSRNVVIVAQEEGGFAPVEVEIGGEGADQTEIRGRLEAGQRVVVSGQFLIDSEASLKGTSIRMSDMPAPGMTEAPIHHGEGKIESIAGNEITLSHGPIPSLQWGAMTMDFRLPPTGLPDNLTVGDVVAFEFHQSDGRFQITSIAAIKPLAGKDRKGVRDEMKEPAQ
ncbi:MAG: efflux RND transporter periplasmic adaptor subunit, partial [Burkholderiales bacterium]